MHSLAKWRETRQLELRVQLLKAVAHPVRLCVVATLAERALCVTELAEALGVAQPIVSQQLRILRMMGLVKVRREDGRSRCELAEPHLRDLLSCLESCCGTRQATGRRRGAHA